MSEPHPPTTVVGAEVDGARADIRFEEGRITRIGPPSSTAGTQVVRADGGALLPGLHDHHLHLLALAARDRSLDVGPAADDADFDRRLRARHRELPAGAWLRVVGYDESHGPLGPGRIDALAPGRPVRVQHRTGAAWMLSGAGAAAAGVEPSADWRFRDDEHLGRAWADDDPPDLAAVSARLAAYGVTGVTDATPFGGTEGFALLAAARARGDLSQRIMVTGGPALADRPVPEGLDRGPVKVVVADHDLPDPDRLAGWFRAAHRAGRPVAVHCVTRVALVLALAAWERAGSIDGDRIEHGSVVPLELVDAVADLGVQVVTQPGFVLAHGDRYLRTVEADDRPHLYRCGTLLDAGVAVAGSTDAPFGPDDPWLGIRAATDRRTRAGALLGPDEAVPPRTALDSFLGPLRRPGGPPRTLEVGGPADLCLLDGPLDRVLADPSSRHVVATWIGGVPVHGST